SLVRASVGEEGRARSPSAVRGSAGAAHPGEPPARGGRRRDGPGQAAALPPAPAAAGTTRDPPRPEPRSRPRGATAARRLGLSASAGPPRGTDGPPGDQDRG